MIPDILMNVEAHIMGHAATFMRMREEAELDWLSVSLLRRMVLVRPQVFSYLLIPLPPPKGREGGA